MVNLIEENQRQRSEIEYLTERLKKTESQLRTALKEIAELKKNLDAF